MGWRSSKRMRYLARPLLAIVATLLALLFCEMVIRLARLAPQVIAIDLDTDASPFQRSKNPRLAYELKANFRGSSREPRHANIVTNSHGQRDRLRRIEKPAGVVRTIVLGDSVVQGVGLADLDQTISRQLESAWGSSSQEVLNFGVDGYCTRAEVELLEVKGLRFQPDQVVLVFVENDFDNFNPELERLASERPAVANRLFRSSALFRLACLKMNLFHFGVELDPISWNTQAIGDNNVVDGLTRLKELSQQHQFQVLIAIWPKFRDQEIVDVHKIPGGDELVIERLAESFHFPTVRLSEFFRQHWQSNDPRISPRLVYTNGDQMHPSPLGCQVAGQSLKSVLEKTGGLADSLKPGKKVDPQVVQWALDLGAKRKPTYYGRIINDAVAAEQTVEGERHAVELYQQASEIHPDLPFAYFNLAILYERQGNLGAARQQYQRAARCRPPHLESHFNLAMLMMRQGDSSQAVKYLKQVVAIQPQHVAAHFNLGIIYRHTGEIELAREEFKTIVLQHPDHHDASRMLQELETGEKAAGNPDGK